MEEQAFTEVWGQKAKATFSDSLMESFTNPDLKKLISKINVLGPANLPTAERERVSWPLEPRKKSSWRRTKMCFDRSLCFLSTIPFWARWTASTQRQRCVLLQRNAGLWSLVRNAPNTLLMCVSKGQNEGENTHVYTHKEVQGLAIQQKNCVSDKLEALKFMHVDQAIDG